MIVKHRVKGSVYRVVMLSTRENDLEPLVNYACVETGHIWTRPAQEFFDGRFVVLPPDPDEHAAPEVMQ